MINIPISLSVQNPSVPVGVSATDSVELNVGATGTPFSLDGAVRYDVEQDLTNAEQEQARDNISAAEVITDTASGDIVNVPDGAGGMDARSLVVSMKPIQDLHGYDHPWPAGGGVNLAKPQVSASNQYYDFANDNGVYSIKRKTDVSSNPRQYLTASFSDIGLADGETYTAYCFDDGQYTYKCGLYNGSGGMAVLDIHTTAYTFVYSARTMSAWRLGVWSNSPNTLPLNTTISFRAMLVKGSTTPSSFATYSNICPISGRTGLTAYRTGKNLLNESADAFDIESQNYLQQYIPVPDGTVITMSLADKDTSVDISGAYLGAFVEIGDSSHGYSWLVTNGSITNRNLSITGKQYITVYPKSMLSTILQRFKIQVELGSASPYEPYTGTSYPVSWQSEAGTVYGCMVDVVSGVLTITDRLYTFNGSENWVIAATGTNRIFRFNNAFVPYIDKASRTPYVANWATPTTIINNLENCGAESWIFRTTSFGTGDCDLLVVTPTANVGMSLDSFKAMLTANPLTICAKLYAPQTYQLTPTEVEMLLGANNIFSDGGSVSLEYPCDTKLYIEKLTKPTEDDMVANANIANDTYFMVGNNLYLSTAAIAAGSTIQVGVNCVSVSLPDALNALKSL